MSKTLISLSFCCEHFKGGDRINEMNGAEHAHWLEEAVDFYRRYGHQVMVGCTGFRGLLYLPAGEERDTFWRIFDKAWIVGHLENPGHQIGAALCIRLALETAGKLGFDNLICSAEDVVPLPGVIENFVSKLNDGYSYTGEIWGAGRNERNAQFFGCKTQALCPTWDACAVPSQHCIERYLEVNLRGQREWLGNETLYKTTHDFNQWRQWVKEVQE